jgi:hypothetical protein
MFSEFAGLPSEPISKILVTTANKIKKRLFDSLKFLARINDKARVIIFEVKISSRSERGYSTSLYKSWPLALDVFQVVAESGNGVAQLVGPSPLLSLLCGRSLAH